MPSIAPSRRQSTATRAHHRAGMGNRATGSRRLLRHDLEQACRRNSRRCQADAPTGQPNPEPSYGCNQQYSITAVTGTSGTIQERYAYTAYGQPTILDGSGSEISNSAISNRILYTGREWDAELALYHYRARMYDPLSGRFVSRDPIGFEGSKWNIFEYVESQPLVKLDPTGMLGSYNQACMVTIRGMPCFISLAAGPCFGCSQAAVTAAAPGCGASCCNGQSIIPGAYKTCVMKCIAKAAGCRFCM